MLSKRKAKKIIEETVQIASGRCDGVEVSIAGDNIATSRFANNHMTQNQAPDNHTLSLRVLKDKKQIRLATSDTSGYGLKKIVDNAIELVKFSEPDDSLQNVISLSESDSNGGDDPRVGIDDRRAIKFDAGQRADVIKGIVEIASENDLTSAGTVSNGLKFEAFGNCNGVFCFHQETHAQCSVTMEGSTSTGWAKGQSSRLKEVSPLNLAKIAADKALKASHPKDIEPGRYTAILEPSAVLDLLGYLRWDLSGTSHLDKQSCLLDKLGDQVFGENINISDDVYADSQTGALFDGAGLKRKKVNLVENGVLNALVYGRRSAMLSKANPTGHGLPEPNNFGEYPMNLTMAGSDSNLDEMIKNTPKGILLSRVWYVRTVDPARKILTGMTRDGTYMISDGEICHGVKNLRFNISLLELFNKVEALGKPVRAAGEETIPGVVPAMKVGDFNFTEVTKF